MFWQIYNYKPNPPFALAKFSILLRNILVDFKISPFDVFCKVKLMIKFLKEPMILYIPYTNEREK